MEPLTIRDAIPGRDAAACAAIYAPHVEASPTSFEERPPSVEELAERIERIAATHHWLVAELGGEVVGYAYACRHRERPAYRWAVDVSAYVSDAHHGRGVGRSLYVELLARLRSQRYRVACAGITLPNSASIALHEHLGFVLVGIFRRIGWKDGAWRDVGWWQLQLADESEEPPVEPRPPARRNARLPLPNA